MKYSFWLIVLLPLTLHARQTATGIHFEQGLNWQAVQDKAKARGKYVFMDCKASWCRPCISMEREIFTQQKVGNFLNNKFISVSVQMDTSKGDNEDVKNWYADARTIMQHYAVKAFPTFLFFSPEGELVHRATGYKNADEFLALAADATNPTRQYYTLRDAYQQKKLADSSLAYLARTAQTSGDHDLAQQVARTYINHLQDSDILTKDNIEFIQSFTQSSKDKGFSLFYDYADSINKIMGIPCYAQGLLDYIIAKEEIDPLLITASKDRATPGWPKLADAITRKYGAAYATRTIIDAKIRWYRSKKQWTQYTKNLITKLEISNGHNLDGFRLNNDAWAIFQRSTDQKELNRAIYWMEKLFEQKKQDAENPAKLDTYANLLYKAGKVNEGIHWEEKALAIATKKKINDYIKTFQNNLDKMRKSQPTWPLE